VLIILTIYGARSPWSPNFTARPLAEHVSTTLDPTASTGATVFFNKGCMYCHEVSGDGGQRGPNLSRIGDRLSENQLIIRINNGGHNMPAFAGRITRDELSSLVEFLQSLTAQSTAPRPNADAERASAK
jgi:ubiquinol-cytochrome c reductase cytochrome b subunit